MASTSVKYGGIQIDGLDETIRALGRLDKEYKKEAVAIYREVAKDIQARSQTKIGRVGRYPNKRGMIGRSATAKGAGVKLRASKYPWAYGAEYGEVVASVFGRSDAQSDFKRRTFGMFKPPTSPDMFQNRGGYMIQPTIRARKKFIYEKSSKDMTKLIDKAMRRAGVPRG